MKKIHAIFPFLIFCSFALNCAAQFKLSGKIINCAEKEQLRINIPEVFGFYQQNSIDIPVADDGTFEIIIPVNAKKFGNLIFKRKFHTLLLSPSKNLNLTLNPIDSSATLLTGSALAENQVVQNANIEEYPFFLANEKYGKLSLAELKTQALAPNFAQRDKKLKAIEHAKISKIYKNLIATEVKYIAYNYINDLARTEVTNRNVVDSLVLYVFDHANTKPEVSNAGPQFYRFVDNYIRFLETKAFAQIKANSIPSNKPIPYFGITLDSANIFVKKYSKAQWRFLGAKANLPDEVTEPYAYQQISNAYLYKDFKQFKDLASAFKSSFPKSKFIANINAKNQSIDDIVKENQTNGEIKIVENYRSVKSIFDVVKQFPGKVVYLDIWGTWCGPCKDELLHTPALKNRFKGKDVAFVYLDMDDDDKDDAWRSFISANTLTGTHIRKTRASMAAIWHELLANAADKAEYYPQYFIFDQTGKLVVAKAKRPSEGEGLYAQINAILNKSK